MTTDQQQAQQLMMHRQVDAGAVLVSLAGEHYCTSHGGRQKAHLPPLLPQCAAFANSIRHQCLRHLMSIAR